MPNWNSKLGIWDPAKEYVVNPKAPKGQEIYEGPDRAAVEVLKEANVDHLGTLYSLDPDMVMHARQLGFNSVDEYLKMYNFDVKKATEAYEAKSAVVVTHKEPEKKKAVSELGGGRDHSGQGKHKFGGFGIPDEVPNSFKK